MKVTFDPTVKLSDILTSLSFILAVLALLYSQQKDRSTSQQERAAETRTIFAASMIKLDRFAELSEAVFDDAQGELVAASEAWGSSGNVIVARDQLWRRFGSIFSDLHKKIVDEKIGGAYIDLYKVDQGLAQRYKDAVDRLRRVELTNEDALQTDSQRAIQSYGGRTGERVTAQMGNSLRGVVAGDREKFEAAIADIIGPLDQALLSSIRLSDAELQFRK